MSKMIAVFEVGFESEDMWDEESLKTDMDGSWLKAMKWLYKSESLGIFDQELRLVAIKASPKKRGSKSSKQTPNKPSEDSR